MRAVLRADGGGRAADHPIPYGAITLQLLFMLLAGLMLPPLMSFLSMAVYVLLGLVGAPVFAAFPVVFRASPPRPLGL